MDNTELKRDWEYCRTMLPKVSRTFALNIEELEGDIFRSVLLGYLLFRIADTFEDTLHRDESEKIQDLRDFSAIFKESNDLSTRLKLYESLKFRWKEDSYEKHLIENGHRVLRCYLDIPEAYRKIIDPLIVETSEGMVKFQKQKLESSSQIFQLADMRELEEYCYYVAGIVGTMLTKIFCLRESIQRKQKELESLQIHFGVALQLINIIKDYRKDIARGWCYIPRSITERYQIKLNRIETLSNKQIQGVMNGILPFIVKYLDSTLRYIKALPLAERSIRMFCIIPFVLGYKTLVKIIQNKGDKISRGEVSGIVTKSGAYAESNNSLDEDYLQVRKDYFEGNHPGLPVDYAG